MPWHAHHGGIVRHVSKDHRSGANPAITSHRDVAQNLRAAADYHVVEKRRVALADFLAGPAERHTLVERDIVTDNGGLADHHTQTMIDEQTSANLRPRMNFNSGKQARHLRQPARQDRKSTRLNSSHEWISYA